MPPEPYRQALRAGARLLWYEIVSVLGQGGFGITYFARDTNLDQMVAIKEYLPVDIARRGEEGGVEPRSIDDTELYVQGKTRFIVESRTLSRFDHPNIVRVYSVFEENNTAYMVMRYEDGEALNDILIREGTLPQAQILAIARPLLDGLAQIHSTGYIHRDVQPGNIYLRRDGSPVLIDFGAARENSGKPRTMTILVAPGYAPIEQYYAHGQEQGPWTDIYGLGATLYRAVAGVAPIDAIERSRGILGSTRDVLVPAIVAGHGRYSEPLLRAIDHALMFNERDRPQSATEWADELDAVRLAPQLATAAVSKLAVVTSPATVPEALTPQSGPSRSSRVAMLFAILTAVAFGAVFVARWTDSPFRAQSAELSLPSGHSRPEKRDLGLAQSTRLSPPAVTAEMMSEGTPAAANVSGAEVSVPFAPGAETIAPTAGVSANQATADKPRSILLDKATSSTLESAVSSDSPDAVKVGTAEHERSESSGSPAEEPGRVLADRIAAESARIAGLESRLKDLERKRIETERRIHDYTMTEGELEPEVRAPMRGVSLKKNVPTASRQNAESAPTSVPAVPRGPQAAASGGIPLADEAQALIERGKFAEARRLLESARPADLRAEFLLANLLRDGKGGAPDQDAGLAHHLHAAELGHLDSQIALARTYASHAGNRYQEPFLAYTWFVVAEQNGAFDIANERDQISRLLQPEQLPQALALALALRASTAVPSEAGAVPGMSTSADTAVSIPK